MTSVQPGNILDRGPEEYYLSEPYQITDACKITSASVKAEIPPKTWVKTALRHAADPSELYKAPWETPETVTCQAGEWIQYRLTIGATNSLRTPRIFQVGIEMQTL